MREVLLLLAGALLLWPRPPTPVSRLDRAQHTGSGAPAGPLRRWSVAALAGGVVLVVGGVGPGTLVLAAGAVVAVERWSRRTLLAGPDVAAVVRDDLPVAADLLAVCLAAGTPVSAAVSAVGAAVGGPLGESLDGVAARLRLGAPPHDAWAEVPAGAAGLARAVVRAGESGSSIVPALQGLAADARTTARSETAAAVQRAGVWVLAPLGLCFLPAFICLGVVPLVLGIAADVLP